MPEPSALAALQAENKRLIKLLVDHGIALPSPQHTALVASEPESPRISTADKVPLFRRLFRGRTDVYPVRSKDKSTRKSGYAPACTNEWHTGVFACGH